MVTRPLGPGKAGVHQLSHETLEARPRRKPIAPPPTRPHSRWEQACRYLSRWWICGRVGLERDRSRTPPSVSRSTPAAARYASKAPGPGPNSSPPHWCAAARYASKAPGPGPNSSPPHWCASPRCHHRPTGRRIRKPRDASDMSWTATGKRDRHWVRRARSALRGEWSRLPLVHASPDRMAWSGRPMGGPEMRPLLAGAPPGV
jgi:hypothetical protein